MQDADGFYADVWRGFVDHIAQFRSHWDSHREWDHQVGQYSVFINVPAGGLRQELSRQGAALRQEFLEPVAPDELHLTLMSIAPSHKVDEEGLQRIIDVVKRTARSFDPFTLTVGGLNGLQESIITEVRPWEALLALRRSLYEALLAEVGRKQFMAPEQFHPHLAVAYVTAAASTDLVKPFLFSKRESVFGELPVNTLDLVELTRSGPHYRNQAVIEAALGKARAAEASAYL
jgi:2'-5' RNA ligase